MSIPASMIKELREATGAGILDCRTALEATQGNLEAATALLQEKGLAAAAKRADRETHNGVLDLYSHGEGRVGVMVEVNCETDFVARTMEFRTFAHEIALQIAATSPRWIRRDDVPEGVIDEERRSAQKQAAEEGKPEAIIERIVEGRLEKYFAENCLLDQGYIRDEDRTVSEVLQEMIAKTGENIGVRRFERWSVGEEMD
ncbi:MAG: elongation factor Ts [Chloroflexi bacterium RBG_19FT_COMBO_62_14]|nr:MAG: elongation factor Ts [Chloroflexi bacterium RBG_19FT_COMBO_62_14]